MMEECAMLKVKTGARNNDQTAILIEGDYAFNGGKLTRKDIEKAARLPEDYDVGTTTRDDNFWYKVIEM